MEGGQNPLRPDGVLNLGSCWRGRKNNSALPPQQSCAHNCWLLPRRVVIAGGSILVLRRNVLAE